MPSKKPTSKAANSSKQQDNEFNFETALEELDTLVEAMEQGDLELEESLKHFEKGIALTRRCQSELQNAEQKVQILIQQSGEEMLTDFTGDDEFEDE